MKISLIFLVFGVLGVYGSNNLDFFTGTLGMISQSQSYAKRSTETNKYVLRSDYSEDPQPINFNFDVNIDRYIGSLVEVNAYIDDEKVLQAFSMRILPDHNEFNRKRNHDKKGDKSIGVFVINSLESFCGTTPEPLQCESRELASIVDLMYANRETNLVDFFKAVSENKLRFNISVFQVVMSDVPESPYSALDNQINSDSGVKPSDYDYKVFLYPQGWIGPPFGNNSGAAGFGELPGTRSWNRVDGGDIFAHELGHNLGFGHSYSYNKTGSLKEYADLSSVMSFGIGKLKRGFDSVQKYLNGWINIGDEILLTNEYGEHRLGSLNSLDELGELKTILLNSTNDKDDVKENGIFVELRKRIGYDSELTSSFRDMVPFGPYYNRILIKKFLGNTKSLILDSLNVGESFILNSTFSITHSLQLGQVLLGHPKNNVCFDLECSLYVHNGQCVGFNQENKVSSDATFSNYTQVSCNSNTNKGNELVYVTDISQKTTNYTLSIKNNPFGEKIYLEIKKDNCDGDVVMCVGNPTETSWPVFKGERFIITFDTTDENLENFDGLEWKVFDPNTLAPTTFSPTLSPTPSPTTPSPTSAPTLIPTNSPTNAPTASPTLSQSDSQKFQPFLTLLIITTFAMLKV